MPEALLIGGRSGVGKSTVGWEVAALLRAAGVVHAVLEGDFMGQVHPSPAGDPDRAALTERNLTAVWGNFAELGYRRLIDTNTASVLADSTGMFERAMGPETRLVRVLLTADEDTAYRRLVGRERGSELDYGLRRSAEMARVLDEQAADGPSGSVPTAVRFPSWPARCSRSAAGAEHSPQPPVASQPTA